eukprot:TRINITY_DN3065_c0_g1_i1.p1 TRINITY_DN3065_c0_g1~~TRINITY_DN3065_c0_g1_i1.p1  ORF type:complete len:155 (+),score=17.75 TRINITY_DN3065_c0_g1_i1:1-465(+)
MEWGAESVDLKEGITSDEKDTKKSDDHQLTLPSQIITNYIQTLLYARMLPRITYTHQHLSLSLSFHLMEQLYLFEFKQLRAVITKEACAAKFPALMHINYGRQKGHALIQFPIKVKYDTKTTKVTLKINYCVYNSKGLLQWLHILGPVPTKYLL